MIKVVVGGFTLLVTIENEKARIDGFEGADSKLSIPKTVSEGGCEYEVTGILKKAFLGCRGLREVVVPETVTEIGDWGFAQCIHLTRVVLKMEPTDIFFGKSVFEGCERLEDIELGAKGEAFSKLMAAVVNKLPGQSLFRDKDAGTREWCERFDLSLKTFLSQNDYEGYSDSALCGEEDISYDGIGSVDGELLGESYNYIKEVTKNKCKLVYLRLMSDTFLKEESRAYYEEYLRTHSLDKKNQAAWYVLKEDYTDDLEYLKLYLEVVAPDNAMIDRMITDMGEKMAQAKAFLIREKTGEDKVDDFFSGLFV